MLLGRLSLRYKFLLILALILVSATAVYFGLAIALFNTDKQAYIYDSNAALVETLGEETATGILSSLKTMRLAALATSTAAKPEDAKRAVDDLFRDDDNFVALAIHQPRPDGTLGEPLVALAREDFLASFNLDPAYADTLRSTFPPPVKLLQKDGLVFQNAALDGGPPLLGVALGTRAEGSDALTLVVSAYLRQDRRFSMFKRSALYTFYMVDAFGNVLAHSDPAHVLKRESFAESPTVKQVFASEVAKGAMEQRDDGGQAKIVAYKKLGIGGLAVVSEIGRDKAFLASRRLVEKSALFGALVLSVSFLVSIFFSRRLTSALQRLYQATLRIAKGEFDFEVQVTSQDEVGALSTSFNRMAREIVRLLKETADKARMEKELETAQLVQENFFPKDDLRVGPLEVAAYFKPASECGGDWWGSIKRDKELILLIGDATGHGVPAALITAAAHSCTTTLERLSGRMKSFPLSPAFIMDSLNAAIYHAGKGRVKMTFFVAVIDAESGRVRYCNASHEMPLLCRGEEHELDTFAEKPDPCLGESLETVYREHEDELRDGDTLVLYTDGLLECRNAAGEEFGERRLTRTVQKAAAGAVAEVKEQLVGKALEFFGKKSLEDDVTLVVVKRNGAAAGARLAS